MLGLKVGRSERFMLSPPDWEDWGREDCRYLLKVRDNTKEIFKVELGGSLFLLNILINIHLLIHLKLSPLKPCVNLNGPLPFKLLIFKY